MRRVRRFLLPLFLIVAALAAPGTGQAQVAVSITVAPPPLPVYAQPPIPGPGWIWTPGYWAWGPYGYYWVPGTWVRPPRVGFLWTPGWWGWANGVYIWHAGYWGPHVGFYGGINYGFGYIGVGYVGGFWDHDEFHYNRVYNNVANVHITNVYNRTVVVHNATHVSFNGGRGGIEARPTRQEETYARERHVTPSAAQHHHEAMARANPQLRSSVNRGHPAIAATVRPAVFTGHGVVHARGFAPSRQLERPAVHRANAAGPYGPGQGPGPGPGHPGPQGGQRAHKPPPHEGQPGGGPDHPHP